MVMYGKPYAEYNSTKVLKVSLQQKKWKKIYLGQRRSGDQSTKEDWNSKKSKTYQSVPKRLFQMPNNEHYYFTHVYFLLSCVSKRVFSINILF